MEKDDKPFVCDAPNCDQKFANSDHLSVHRQKHQLSLSIGLRPGESLVDQTPTPTRFLPKTAEGGELFEGLPEPNPFDQDFKKATPVSLPAVSSVSDTVQPFIAVAPVAAPSKPPTTEKTSTVVATTENISKLMSGNSDFVKKLSTAGIVIIGPSPPKAAVSSQSTVITDNQRQLIIASKGNTPTIIVNPASTSLPANGMKTQRSGGQIRSAVPHPAIMHARQNGNADADKTALAKQKLKEILKQNSMSSALTNQVKSTTTTSALQQHQQQQQQQQSINASFSIISNASSSPCSSVNSPEAQDYLDDDLDMDLSGSQAKRSRRSQDEMDPDERRKRFLERNRAAASRCRQKRKVWVQQLEKKADDLSATNTVLQGEISHLRTEVAQLKGLLLAHKDCPVTMQQKAVIEHSVISIQPLSEQHHIETDEEVASSALTDMANQNEIDPNAAMRLIPVISEADSRTIDANNSVNGH
eukprot:gene3220-3697_t